MPEGQLLEFSGITKRFGAVSAVSDLSARVEPGRVTGFLGPNGAGKTTSLRILLGLVRATSGAATIGGASYASLRRPLQTVGAVLEASSFHPGRSAANHLKVYAQAAGLPLSRVADTLGLVGLADVGGRKVGGFSMGMRQRLGLAYALLGDPGVLVLDEPANGLDPEGIKWMRGFLRQLAREGRTVLVSSHLLAEVQQTVDSVLIISQGRLVYEGALEDLADPSEFATVVDSPDRAALGAALTSAGASFELFRSGLTVRGLDPAAVGGVAASAGVALSSLQRRGPALEEVFLDLVSGVRVHPTAAGGADAAAAMAPVAGGDQATADEAAAVATGLNAENAGAPGAAVAAGAAALAWAGADSDEDAEPPVEPAIDPSPSATFAVASTGVIDIVPFAAGDPATDAYADGLPLDEDPDVEALGAIDAELSEPDLPPDDPEPVPGDRPWENYVKTEADVEADAFFASFTAREAAEAAEAAAAGEAAEAAEATATTEGTDAAQADDSRTEADESVDEADESADADPDDDTSERGTLADLSPDRAEDVAHAPRDDEGGEQR
ncbi:MAG TPA: ATP-binding cassette domain-containing protein [Microbacterium sp.]|nr:ATP-binding cassette domain-containing protein [Microbacterium sp.]